MAPQPKEDTVEIDEKTRHSLVGVVRPHIGTWKSTISQIAAQAHNRTTQTHHSIFVPLMFFSG
jgi:hypothetical protein